MSLPIVSLSVPSLFFNPSMAEREKNQGMKNAAGSLKLAAFKNSVQEKSPVGMFFPPVVALASMNGSGK